MADIPVDADLVAHCGLYCGACRGYLKDKCPGCRDNEKARWCKVRTCCRAKDYATCADCEEYADPHECKKFHNFISRIVGFVLSSDRRACIYRIRDVGAEEFAREMAESERQTIHR